MTERTQINRTASTAIWLLSLGYFSFYIFYSALTKALADVSFSDPSFSVYANVTGKPTHDPQATLVAQLTGAVRFSETLENIAAQGVDTFVHIGPGEVTAGLAKRTIKDATVHVVSSLEEARTVAEKVSVE